MKKKFAAFGLGLTLWLNSCQAEATLSQTLGARPIGDELKGRTFADLGTALPQLKTTTVDTDGTLIFSDSPEYVKEDGILYQDTVKGKARVLYYHLNDSPQAKKVAVVLENRADKPVTIRIKRSGDGRPNAEMYCELGKETQTAYFEQSVQQVIELAVGEKKILQEFMDKRIVKPQELVYGVYDFTADDNVNVAVISYPVGENPYRFLEKAAVLPADEIHLRGTFTGMDRLITVNRPYDPHREGPACITLADDDRDPYKRGIDATDGSEVVNQGNYGINYWIDIPTVGRGKTRYLLAPLGGVYAGAMRIHDGREAYLCPTPADSVWFGDKDLPEHEKIAQHIAIKQGFDILFPDSESTLLGNFTNGRSLLFEYSPPGASNLPVIFVLLPAEK